MKTIGIKIKYLLIAILVCIMGIAAMSFAGLFGAAKADTTISGADDEFLLSDTSFAADEKFVFTATAEFQSGNAAGLVFGADDGKSYWVFNVDRADNAVKLMYFDFTSGEKVVHVLKREYYVGTAAMNDGEKNYVKSRTATIDKVYLKVAITPTPDGTLAEFYADGIRRFAYVDGSAEAEELDLDSLTAGEGDDAVTFEYNGGYIGYNCFSATVRFTDEAIGEDDPNYYSEIYRNQYHFSQYAHWNNDPNGLVYYNGYYHMYFQHNPYGNTWDTMHWGHARSTDLVHWEMLPIALVPDYDLPVGDNKLLGAMWSGSARVYHKGDSDKIDNEYKWFGDTDGVATGDALGLIGWYTWFGDGGNRYQVTMYSTDGGLSWNKRDNIPCSVSKNLDGSTVNGGSWRDPKVFDISGIDGIADGYKWGMVLTDMEDNTLFFLKSKNLIDWEHAGSYGVYRPECPDLVYLDDGSKTRVVITFTSRYYVVCDLAFESGNIVMKDGGGNKITSLMQGDPRLKTMDYGVDSYAAQTFYIDGDSDSAYAGKSVSVSWFSGVPNAPESIESGVLQSARKTWNGGGMTIPVVYGLDGETLVTTPITATDAHFATLKTTLVDMYYSPMQDGLLANVASRTAEIRARLSNPSRTGVAFKVNMSADGSAYTEIGWNRTDGYYVDRTYTEDADIIFPQPNYAVRYDSGKGKDNTVLDFYILVDRNNVEVYCDGFTVPFYILTFGAPHSQYMSFTSESDLNILELEVNTIDSVWRDGDASGTLYVSDTEIELDTTLTSQKKVTVVADAHSTYEIASGEGIVELVPTDIGFTVKALSAGNAVIEVRSGELSRLVNVTVHSGAVDTDLTFSADGILSGEWLMSGDTLVGIQTGGDGYMLAEESGADFIYSASFDIGSGAAAALVFRATETNGTLDSYLIANFDRYGNVVKLWSQNGEIARAGFVPSDVRNITLSASVEGDRVMISIDGVTVINAVLGANEPQYGRFGLNVCATRAAFRSVRTVLREYEYDGGTLSVSGGGNTRIYNIVNNTFYHTDVPFGAYTLIGNELIFDNSYLSILPSAGVYSFAISGDKLSFGITVNVKALPDCSVSSVTVNEGSGATVFIGKRETEYVKVNGVAVASALYEIKNYTVRLDKTALAVGDNIVTLSDGTLFIVSVIGTQKETVSVFVPPVPLNYTPFAIGFGLTCGIILLLAVALVVLYVLWKKGKLAVTMPFGDRTEAIKRRNLGLIVAACIAGPVALIFAVCAATAPIGTIGLAVTAAVVVLFGYPYIAQLVWKGKLYFATVSPMKTMGTPKEIFDIDKEGNKFKLGLRYVGAAFKTLWLCIRIFLCAVVSLIRAPFLFIGQLKGVTYGEFEFSNRAESVTPENVETAEEAE